MSIFQYGDPAERAYALEKGLFIRFIAMNTALSAEFKAFLTSYDDSFTSEWASEQPFGRTDASRQFSHTMRRIDISWSTVAYDENEARENLQKCTALTQMLYPIYEDRGGKQLDEDDNLRFPPHMGICAPPLVMVEFANLMNTIAPQNVSIFDKVNSARMGPSTGQGLIACIESYTFTPRVQEGFFDVMDGDFQKLLPKIIDLSCRFVVLHQVSPGIAEISLDRETALSAYGDLYRVGYGDTEGADSNFNLSDAESALEFGQAVSAATPGIDLTDADRAAAAQGAAATQDSESGSASEDSDP